MMSLRLAVHMNYVSKHAQVSVLVDNSTYKGVNIILMFGCLPQYTRVRLMAIYQVKMD